MNIGHYCRLKSPAMVRRKMVYLLNERHHHHRGYTIPKKLGSYGPTKADTFVADCVRAFHRFSEASIFNTGKRVETLAWWWMPRFPDGVVLSAEERKLTEVAALQILARDSFAVFCWHIPDGSAPRQKGPDLNIIVSAVSGRGALLHPTTHTEHSMWGRLEDALHAVVETLNVARRQKCLPLIPTMKAAKTAKRQRLGRLLLAEQLACFPECRHSDQALISRLHLLGYEIFLAKTGDGCWIRRISRPVLNVRWPKSRPRRGAGYHMHISNLREEVVRLVMCREAARSGERQRARKPSGIVEAPKLNGANRARPGDALQPVESHVPLRPEKAQPLLPQPPADPPPHSPQTDQTQSGEVDDIRPLPGGHEEQDPTAFRTLPAMSTPEAWEILDRFVVPSAPFRSLAEAAFYVESELRHKWVKVDEDANRLCLIINGKAAHLPLNETLLRMQCGQIRKELHPLQRMPTVPLSFAGLPRSGWETELKAIRDMEPLAPKWRQLWERLEKDPKYRQAWHDALELTRRYASNPLKRAVEMVKAMRRSGLPGEDCVLTVLAHAHDNTAVLFSLQNPLYSAAYRLADAKKKEEVDQPATASTAQNIPAAQVHVPKSPPPSPRSSAETARKLAPPPLVKDTERTIDPQKRPRRQIPPKKALEALVKATKLSPKSLRVVYGLDKILESIGCSCRMDHDLDELAVQTASGEAVLPFLESHVALLSAVLRRQLHDENRALPVPNFDSPAGPTPSCRTDSDDQYYKLRIDRAHKVEAFINKPETRQAWYGAVAALGPVTTWSSKEAGELMRNLLAAGLSETEASDLILIHVHTDMLSLPNLHSALKRANCAFEAEQANSRDQGPSHGTDTPGLIR